MAQCNHGLMRAFKLTKKGQENETTTTLWLDGDLTEATPDNM